MQDVVGFAFRLLLVPPVIPVGGVPILLRLGLTA